MTSQNISADSLRTLHRIHRQLGDLRSRLERGPRQIRTCEAHVAHQQQQVATVEGEAKKLRMAADAKQVQLKGGEDKIVELKRKLNTAASNREYQALKDQIAAQEMTNSVLADEILEAMEKTDGVTAKVEEAKQGLKQAEQKSQKVHGEVQQQQPLIEGDITRLEGELKQCESALPADVRELYDRVVRHRGEDALAPVENQTCGGCYQQVQLNLIADIMMSKPRFCKSCGRMLYIPEDGSSSS